MERRATKLDTLKRWACGLVWLGCSVAASWAQEPFTNRFLELDGNGDYLELPVSAFAEESTVTVELRARWDSFGFYSTLFDFRVGDFQFHVHNKYTSNHLDLTRHREGHIDLQTQHNLLALGRWFHLAVVCGPDTLTTYMDGKRLPSFTGREPRNSEGLTTRNLIGLSNWKSFKPPIVEVGPFRGDEQGFHGLIDEVRIWRGERTAEEIEAHQYSRLTGNEAGLIALLNFDDVLHPARNLAQPDESVTFFGDAKSVALPLPGPAEGRVSSQPLGGTAQLAGRVTAMNATPLDALVVQVVTPSSPGEETSVVAAKRTRGGHFEFLNLRPGPYQLRCYTDNGYVYYRDGAVLELANNRHPLIDDFRIPSFQKGTWSHLSYLDGLISDEVYHIAQDSSGAYWFATRDGFSRYDGQHVRNYPLSALLAGPVSIPCEHTILEPLLVYSSDRYILRHGDEIRLLPTPTRQPDENGGDSIPTLPPVIYGRMYYGAYQDRDDSIWIPTYDGIYRFDGKEITGLTSAHGLPKDNVRALLRDEEGDFWLGTHHGLYRHDGRTWKAYTTEEGLISNRILDLHVDSSGMLWIATENGLSRFDGTTFENFDDLLPLEVVRDIYEGRDGYLWFATAQGAVRYDGTGFTYVTSADGLASDALQSIYGDSLGNLWFASLDAGVSRYDPITFQRFGGEAGLESEYIHFVVEDAEGNHWIGNRGNIARWDGHRFQQFPGAFDATCATLTDRGELWIGTWNEGRIARWNHDAFVAMPQPSFPRFSYAVNDILAEPGNTLLVATETGVYRHSDTGFSSLFASREDKGPDELARASDGSLWISAGWHQVGFSLYRWQGGSVDEVFLSGVRPTPKIDDLYVAPNQTVWAATSRGAAYLDGEVWRLFRPDAGVAEAAVTCVFQDSLGVMWFGTRYGGVYGYDGQAWTSINSRQGLPSNHVKTISEDSSGTLWMGTIAGLLRYQRNLAGPQVKIASIQIAEDVYGAHDPIPPIDVKQGVTFSLDAIDFKTPKKDEQFRYRVPEVDPNWSRPSKERFVNLRLKKPGGYTFCVQGIDRDLRYSETATVAFQVILPWYRNNALLGSLALLVFLSLCLTLYAYVRQAASRKELDMLRANAWSLLNSAPDGMLVLTQSGKIAMANDRVSRMLGFSSNELLDQPFSQLFHLDSEADEENLAEYWESPVRDQEVMEEEFVARTRDGHPLPVDVCFSRVDFDEQHVTAAIRDITNRKQFEEELQSAKTTAEESTHAKSDFLAKMSHEIRTPLHAILGFTELLRNDATTEANHQEKLEIIDRSGKHLLGMIEEILDLSKIEAGRVELRRETFQFDPFLQDICAMMKPRAAAKGLRFVKQLSSSLPTHVKADPGKIGQVLLNLLGNAVKYTGQGEVCLHVEEESSPDANNIVWVVFEVADTGSGIPAKRLETIFESFVQVESNPDGDQGVGLGLAISKSLVELLEGQLEVESAVDVGSTFRLRIPLSVPTEASGMSQLPRKREIIGMSPSHGDLRILVVDDHLENRLLLTSLFEQIGFVVREAHNGEQAIHQFEEWHPDLICMDLRMPVLDGLQATQRIRKLPGGDSVKIIAITANVTVDQRAHALKKGSDELLGKPVRMEDILDAVGRLLGIQFEYRSRSKPPSASTDQELTPQMLACLPADILEDLNQAALLLDQETLIDILPEVAKHQPETAMRLHHLVAAYQMSRIHELLSELS